MIHPIFVSHKHESILPFIVKVFLCTFYLQLSEKMVILIARLRRCPLIRNQVSQEILLFLPLHGEPLHWENVHIMPCMIGERIQVMAGPGPPLWAGQNHPRNYIVNGKVNWVTYQKPKMDPSGEPVRIPFLRGSHLELWTGNRKLGKLCSLLQRS
jgi:hypothetical protein